MKKKKKDPSTGGNWNECPIPANSDPNNPQYWNKFLQSEFLYFQKKN